MQSGGQPFGGGFGAAAGGTGGNENVLGGGGGFFPPVAAPATAAPFAGGFGAAGGTPAGAPIVFGGGFGGGNAGGAAAATALAGDDRKKHERAARFQTTLTTSTTSTTSLSAAATPFAPTPGQEQQQQQQYRRKNDTNTTTNTATDPSSGPSFLQQAKKHSAQKRNIVGTCEDMCPVQERERRQNMSDIQIFERVHLDNMNLTSAELAVKRFARTVDDPHPSEFRTRGALARTMEHLRGLLDREDVRFGLVHKFLWDRYRSVRQDLYIQGITDEFAIGIFEEIVRFHVMCEHELCGEDQSITDMEGFNSHLNMEQMNKALISLNDMYERAAERGEPCPTEPEFRAYHLLSLMAQHGKFKGDQQAFLSTLQSLRLDVREDERVQWVLKLRNAYYFGNFARFFRLVGEAPYLMACLAHVYFPFMRATCFRVMSETCARQQNLEASWLVRTLLLDDAQEALAVAKEHGFLSSLDSGDRDPVVVLTKGGFEKPETVVRYPSKAVSAKSGGMRRSDLILTVAEESDEARRARLERLERMRAEREEERRRARAREEAAEEAARRQQRELAAREQEREEEEEKRRRARAREEAAQEEERRRVRALEEAAQEERRRAREREAAEEASRRQQRELAEEARRVAAAEEDRRRVAAAAEELRRQEELRRKRIERLAEEQRLLEEARRQKEAEEARRRQYLLSKLREAIVARRHWDMWVSWTQERLAEKERRRITKLNLEGCRVGVLVPQKKRIKKREGTDDLVDGFSERLSLDHTSMESILDIVREVVVGLDDGATTRSNNPRHHVYWKVSVLTPHANIAGDPLARRLRARALSRRGDIELDSTDSREEGMRGGGVEPGAGGISIPSGGASSSGNNLGELVCQESQLVTTCVQFVPGWKDEDGMATYMAGSSGLVVVNVCGDTLSRSLRAAAASWKGPKLPVRMVFFP